ncbi:hypothetical protein GCM10008018_61060 [Paenibacillus marchantiophytorum]|uniref:DUF5668 domain-containing protein n=1 Tax=Paenibacillus marchantiophytorum TaxID=1619310 RepID=A0ABQ1FD02_9BACL|nr:hypothetical protein [Paenibacillus marchantiophytorum]GGA07012.1 hypothetical protein GCM10008018_61060 [Paenibacillus marchantiophytorum]
MRLDRSKSIALLFITVGLLICLHQFGHLMGWLVPVSMVVLGYVGIKNDKKIGWLIFGIGALILTFKLSGLLILGLAVWMLVYGFRMLKKQDVSSNHEF